MTPLAKLESRPATFVTPWRTPSLMSVRSVLAKDDDDGDDAERFGPQPNSSSLEMLELPSNLLRFVRISNYNTVHSLVHAPHVTDCSAGQTRRLGAKVLRPRPFDWIEQCFTFPPTQYRLYGGRFLQVKRPNQQYQSNEGTYRTQKNQKYNNQTINTKHSKSPSLH